MTTEKEWLKAVKDAPLNMPQKTQHNNPESLRTQLIDAISPRLGVNLANSVFEHDLWPVLQAAMKAGELLVARNTTPQIPVAQAIQGWLEGVLTVVERVREDEKIISKAKLLRILYDLETIGQLALKDAKELPL